LIVVVEFGRETVSHHQPGRNDQLEGQMTEMFCFSCR
jgi:hypothetical protein